MSASRLLRSVSVVACLLSAASLAAPARAKTPAAKGAKAGKAPAKGTTSTASDDASAASTTDAEEAPAPPAPTAAKPTVKSAAKVAPTDDALDSDSDSDAKAGNVPFYIPAPSEAFKPPVPVVQRLMVLSASTDHHWFGSTIGGWATEVRAHLGWPTISFNLGALLSGGETLYGAGLSIGRYAGIPVYGVGTGHELRVLLPTLDVRGYASKESTYTVVGSGLTGVRYCSCGADGGLSMPLKVEVRLPVVSTWKGNAGHYSGPSYGIGFDAGLFF